MGCYMLNIYKSGNIQEGKVVAIELSLDNFVRLEKNLEVNNCKTVSAAKKALSDRKIVVELNSKVRNSSVIPNR